MISFTQGVNKDMQGIKIITLIFSLGLGACTPELNRTLPYIDPLFVGNIGYWKLNEASGSTVVGDSSPISNTGTVLGTTSLGNTGFSSTTTSAHFDSGSSSYISIPRNANYNVSTFTASAWVKSSQNLGIRLIFNGDYLPVDASPSGRKFQFRLNIGYFGCTVLFNDANDASSSTELLSITMVSDGNWHHLACTYDQTKIQVYVDGVLNNTVAENRALNNETPHLYIGQWNTDINNIGQYLLTGYVSQVGLWNRALSATEITELFTR